MRRTTLVLISCLVVALFLLVIGQARAQSLTGLVLLSDGTPVIQPIQEVTAPSVYRNGFGAERTVSGGVFLFPCESFEPSDDVTIVIVGTTRNREWTIYKDELLKMR